MFKRNKADEMDKEIRSKSIITAHYYTQFMLIVWIIIYTVKNRTILMPMYVLLVGLLVRGASSLIFRHDFEDERWKKGLVILLSATAAVVFLFMLSFGKTKVGI
ncbi:MAG: hypothetical protein K6F71_07385 [Ruminococcus sp.]|uniref:hypothetical protein n=1 Tax=Ruminococcus sp. TaxID=41978 RepID=UPI0025EB49D4|nr:hypothetical protein [Ruminococcus sp.]MCR5540624.1 hypothetical protein [Ruminococcus sp.]